MRRSLADVTFGDAGCHMNEQSTATVQPHETSIAKLPPTHAASRSHNRYAKLSRCGPLVLIF
jgi:hypothetical protein